VAIGVAEQPIERLVAGYKPSCCVVCLKFCQTVEKKVSFFAILAPQIPYIVAVLFSIAPK
jgi:hypothetical protein